MTSQIEEIIKKRPHLKEVFKNVKTNKYGAKKTVIDGVKFDSMAEARRYSELKMLENAGVISNLELQPKFNITDSVVWEGKTLRARNYIADFKYIQDGKEIVEDTKGCKTELYKLKKILFLLKYPQYVFVESRYI
jgi:hypothetical protein